MKKVLKFLGNIALAAVIGFSMVSCPTDDGGNPGKKDDPQVFVVDLSNNEDSNWDYMVVGKDGSSILFRVDESSDIPTTLFLKTDKDSDVGFSYFFDENGLPDKMVANGIVFCFDNFNGYQLDFTVIYPDDTVEYVLGIETDVNWDAYNGASGRRSIGQARSANDIKKGFEIVENVVGGLTCIGTFIPPLTAVLAVGCGAFVVDKIADAVIDEVFDGAMEDGAGLIKDSIGCVTGVLKGPAGWVTGIPDCGQAVFGAADLITNEDKNLIEETKDKIADAKDWMAEIRDDFSITTESFYNCIVGEHWVPYYNGYLSTTAKEYGDTVWEIVSGGLPPGLRLSYDYEIIGTPEKAGTFNFTVKATNSMGFFKYKRSALKALSITVKERPVAPTIPAASLPNGTVGTPYARLLSVNGDAPIKWSFENGILPPGLSFSEKGTITGTPTEAGTFNFSVTATNIGGSNSRQFSITIVPASNPISGGLTINNLPSGETSFNVMVFYNGTDISTYDSLNTALYYGYQAAGTSSGSIFNLIMGTDNIWTETGAFPVLLESVDLWGTYIYRWTMVNFLSGTGTASFNSFMIIGDERGTEADPIPLTAGVWAYGNINSSTVDNAVWYSFDVTSGTTYYVWLDDAENAGGTLDASIGAFYSYGGNYIFTLEKNSRSFKATANGTVKMKVYPDPIFAFVYTGTFAVAYSTNNTKPGYGGTGGGDNPGGGGNPTGGPTTWTAVTSSPFGTSEIEAIAYGNGRFVAGDENGQIAYSSDGITWILLPNELDFSIREIAYGNDRFVAVSYYSFKSAYSQDGINWTQIENDNSFYHIAYGGGKFIGVTNSSMKSSIDGINWTETGESHSSESITAIAYGSVGSAGYRFVTVDIWGKLKFSLDGISWTAVSDVELEYYTGSLAYGNNMWVTGGYTNSIRYSPDCLTWTRVSGNTFGGSSINAIAYGNNRFVAVGDDGKIAYCNW